jgi:hypothetical protein
MTVGMLKISNARLRVAVNFLAWILIAGLAGATLVWSVWSAHQPRPHSAWGEPSDKPLN